MVQESVQCEKCGAIGWITAVPIHESANMLVVCDGCGTHYKYSKKPFRNRKIEVFTTESGFSRIINTIKAFFTRKK